MEVDPLLMERSRNMAKQSPAQQAAFIRELMQLGLDPEMAQRIVSHIRGHQMHRAWDDLNRVQSAWARIGDWAAVKASPALLKLSGMDTREREGAPRFAALRQRVLLLSDVFERPYVRVLERGRAYDAEHMQQLYEQLGDDAALFMPAARQGRVEDFKPHTGTMQRTSSPEAEQARFEAMVPPGRHPVIEPGIMPLVAAINAWGIATSQSCEGHLDRGVPAPWLMFEASATSKMQRLLDEAGNETFVLMSLGRDTSRLVVQGAAHDQTGMVPAEREHHAEDLARWQAEVASLAGRINELPDRLAPAVEISSIDDQAPALDVGIEPDLNQDLGPGPSGH